MMKQGKTAAGTKQSKKSYDRAAIMRRAWEISDRREIGIDEAMKLAWAEAKGTLKQKFVTARKLEGICWEIIWDGGYERFEAGSLPELWYWMNNRFCDCELALNIEETPLKDRKDRIVETLRPVRPEKNCILGRVRAFVKRTVAAAAAWLL